MGQGGPLLKVGFEPSLSALSVYVCHNIYIYMYIHIYTHHKPSKNLFINQLRYHELAIAISSP